MIRIAIADHQQAVPLDRSAIRRAVRSVLREAGVRRAAVSVAVVDDPTIHALNRRHLGHDYPTDVLSFLFEWEADELEGEIVVGAETALRAAVEFDWPAQAELLLYVIHGALHLVGHDDRTPRQRRAMRQREAQCLAEFGLAPKQREAP